MVYYKTVLWTFLLSISLSLIAGEYRMDPKTSKAIPNFAGKVLMVRGQVFKIIKDDAEASENSFALKVGAIIKEGDVIHSEKKSFAKIRMSDDSLVTVGPTTKLKIEKFEFHSKEKRNVIYNLINGRIRCYVLNKVKKPYSIKIKSKHAALGVRGTEILANHIKDFGNKYQTEFALLSGKAMIVENNSEKDIAIKAGERVVLYGKDRNLANSFRKGNLDKQLMKKLISSDSYNDKMFPLLLRPIFANNVGKHRQTRSTVIKKSNKISVEKNNWRHKLKKLNKMLKDTDE